MFKRSREFISHIRGNPKALATLLATVVCAAFAFILNSYSQTALLAGALAGAAVSTAVAYLIEFLETPDAKIRPEFINSLKREILLVGYYREHQDIDIELVTGHATPRIKIVFRSRIVPVRSGETVIEYPFPKIAPPETQFKRLGEKILIDGEVISRGSRKTIEGPADELVTVEYQVVDPSAIEYSDDHRWRAPILNYDVRFRVPPGFDCELDEVLDKDYAMKGKHLDHEIRFSHKHAAFCQQGFVWRMRRSAAHPA